MKYLDFYNKLETMKNKEYIENYLVYSTSLIIAGVKPAVTITIKKDNKKLYETWCKYGELFLKSINLKFIELRKSTEYMILMIYDENILENNLNTKIHIDFLIKLGYPRKIEINEYLETLKVRYKKYHCPHELGLFLGIPFEDVKDFMECNSKKCLLCGYWKVYNNSKKAQNIFRNYDEVKEYTIESMMEGNLSRDLVFKIKDSFQNKICG